MFFVVLTITVTWLLGDTTFSQPKDLQVGINSGPGNQGPGTRGPTKIQFFFGIYTVHNILYLY